MQPDFLNSHKNLLAEIGSHTDSRGDAKKNLDLSKRRAENICTELIKRFGVDSIQVKPKGYGKTKLLKNDAEIAKVKTLQDKEVFHMINRRTELKIIEVK